MRYVSKTIFVIVAALLMGVVPATAQKKKERKAKTEQTQQADNKAEVKEENNTTEEQEKTEKAEETKAKEEQPKKEFSFDEKAPMMNPDATPRLYYIRDVNVHGVEHMNENLIRSTSGLIPGDTIYQIGRAHV